MSDAAPATADDVASAPVVHVEDLSRYELRLGEDAVGVLEYRTDGDRVVLEHTFVDPERRQRGMGARLARGALDDVRERGLRAVAQCPFVARFVEDHPEYADLVDDA